MTTLSITPLPALAAVLLEVESAPMPQGTLYTSNFTTVDGWSAVDADTATTVSVGAGGVKILVTHWLQSRSGTVTTEGQSKRTVTGLIIGQTYRFTADAMLGVTANGKFRIGVVGIGASTYVSSTKMTPMSYQFVATATSHDIYVTASPTTSVMSEVRTYLANVKVDNVTAGWRDLTITRVDANGANVVRLLEGQQPIGGALSVTDYEAALVGTVRYDVVDGNGVVTSQSMSFASGALAISRTNLIVNPSFETNVLNWTANSSTLSRVTTQAAVGSASMAMTMTGAGAGGATSDAIPVGPGNVITLQALVRAATTVRGAYVALIWYDGTGASISTSTGSSSTNSNSAWGLRSLTATAPANAVTCKAQVLFATPAASEVHYADAVMVEKASSAGTYFDGNTTDTGTETYAWTGTTNNSTSTLSVFIPSTPVTQPFIHLPVLPQYRAELDAVTDYDATRDAVSTRHEVVDRADPIYRLGPQRTRQGTLQVWASDYETALLVEAIFTHSEVAMLRQPDYPGMDMYFIPERTRLSPGTASVEGQRWSVEVGFVEVLAPTGPLQGAAGWTFDNVAAYATFLDVRASFATFSDLTVGP